jgi:hypothetical protein
MWLLGAIGGAPATVVLVTWQGGMYCRATSCRCAAGAPPTSQRRSPACTKRHPGRRVPPSCCCRRLQIQTRDIPGFVDTRYRLLQLRSNNRNNWVSFAIAHHLDGNYDMAVSIISAYESTVVRGWQEGRGSSRECGAGALCVCGGGGWVGGGQAAP